MLEFEEQLNVLQTEIIQKFYNLTWDSKGIEDFYIQASIKDTGDSVSVSVTYFVKFEGSLMGTGDLIKKNKVLFDDDEEDFAISVANSNVEKIHRLFIDNNKEVPARFRWAFNLKAQKFTANLDYQRDISPQTYEDGTFTFTDDWKKEIIEHNK